MKIALSFLQGMLAFALQRRCSVNEGLRRTYASGYILVTFIIWYKACFAKLRETSCEWKSIYSLHAIPSMLRYCR